MARRCRRLLMRGASRKGREDARRRRHRGNTVRATRLARGSSGRASGACRAARGSAGPSEGCPRIRKGVLRCCRRAGCGCRETRNDKNPHHYTVLGTAPGNDFLSWRRRHLRPAAANRHDATDEVPLGCDVDGMHIGCHRRCSAGRRRRSHVVVSVLGRGACRYDAPDP